MFFVIFRFSRFFSPLKIKINKTFDTLLSMEQILLEFTLMTTTNTIFLIIINRLMEEITEKEFIQKIKTTTQITKYISTF